MAWSADAAKRQEWSERLQRFSQSTATVAAFCKQEQVSVAAYYHWRRKLGAPVRNGAAACRVPKASTSTTHAFVPVQITQAAVVRMRLPNGVELWLPSGDAPMLAAAIIAAGRLASSGGEGAAC